MSMLSGLKCDFWHLNVHFTDGAHLMIFSEPPPPTKINAPPMGCTPPSLKKEVPPPRSEKTPPIET